MEWIRRGLQVGQAVRNAHRLRQIIGTLSKYGFVDVVEKMNLGKFLPSKLAQIAQSQADRAPQERLRLAFEELGPTFVKLGQLLSTRPDLLPESYIEEFTKLQDNVQPLSFEIVQSTVERELGKKLSELYAEFDAQPLAAASIGQVHTAKLHTGERVVVKVQRPGIEKIIDTDVSLLAFLAGLLEKYVPETRVIGPRVIVDEFFRTLAFELDFNIEANNMSKIAENMASVPEIVIPKVYKSLSTARVLTEERLEGIRVNDIAALDAAGIDRGRVVDIGARAFFQSVMIDGLFHGDLHGGNMFILPGNKLGIIDFGIVGRLSPKSRDSLASMVMALMTEDYETLCYQYAELGSSGSAIDFEGFEREVRNSLAPYLGLALQDLNVGKVLIEATKIATRYNIQVPGDWMIVFKAILTLEGMGRKLKPDFDLLATGQDLVKDLVKKQYSPERFSRDLMWMAKDVGALLQMLPRQIRWALKKFNRDNYAFEIKSPDLENIRDQLETNGQRSVLSLLVVGLMIAGAISLQHSGGHRLGDYPVISLIFFLLGAWFLFRLWLKSFLR